jgi:hypothetical protein
MASAMHIRGINVPNSRLLLNLLLFGMEPTLVCRDSHHSQLYMAVKTLPKMSGSQMLKSPNLLSAVIM